MRHTSGHTRNRRSHHGLKVARFETCKDCNAKHLMHRVCSNCGKYRGRLVIDVLKKVAPTAKNGEALKAEKKTGEKKPAKKTTKAEKEKKEAKEKKEKK